MIEGVRIKHLTRHVDDRGWLMEILRDDDEIFTAFGQVYVSAAFPGVVKAWHCHQRQTDSFCVLVGNAKIGLFDDRQASATRGQAHALVAGELNPIVVQIPPLVWHGFMALEGRTALVLNVPNAHYNRDQPDELRRDPFDPDIPFEWCTQGG
ncbi:MAG: dTDP-4-dehydrorhamnose 3,5-epimerase family protein [Armatimonadota bacterium]